MTDERPTPQQLLREAYDDCCENPMDTAHKLVWLERERDEAREALQFYADKESWQRVQQGAYDEPEIVIPALEDGGDRARAILAKAKP